MTIKASNSCIAESLRCFLLLQYDFQSTALALGDLSVTIEDVSPSVYPAGPLFPSEVVLFFYLVMSFILFGLPECLSCFLMANK